jgi:succinate dehydrogenase / fumarate reductase cytochrome b subunit
MQEDNSMSERPLSPHLQVYKPQMTSVLSITHRATGVFLTLGAIYVVYWLYAVAQGGDSFVMAQAIATHWLGQLVLLGLTFATFFHLANGCRHLLWDAGMALELGPAYQTGWAVLIFSILGTGMTWWLILGGAA